MMLVRHLAWQVRENLGGKWIKPKPTSIRYILTFEVLIAGPDASKESSRFVHDRCLPSLIPINRDNRDFLRSICHHSVKFWLSSAHPKQIQGNRPA